MDYPPLDISQLESRISAGWLGKNIGGTLGMPYEGQPALLNLSFYNPVPTEPQSNDDFEIQLIWLAMMRERGIRLRPVDFQTFFNRHLSCLIAEYKVGLRNFRNKILPPMSGAHNNWFINGMGAAIRSEIWAMIAPGRPEVAAAFAYMDSIMDHAEEGVTGEMFLAALQSLAFVESDPLTLLEKALRFIPAQCQVAQVVRMVIREFEQLTDPIMVRNKVLAEFGHAMDFTHVPTNLGFTVIGFLYGNDFGDALCLAVNCGYDTDCTGATLGALLGIIQGRESLPANWLAPIGEKVVATDFIKNLDFPRTIDTLTAATMEIAQKVANDDGLIEHLYRWTGLEFLKHPGTPVELPSTTRVLLACDPSFKVSLDYGDQPAVGYGELKPLSLRAENLGSKPVAVSLDLAADADLEILDEQGNAFASHLQITLADGETWNQVIGVRIKAGQLVKMGAGKLTLKIAADTKPAETVEVGLAYKSCWQVTQPIDSTDQTAIEAIETAGSLESFVDGEARQQLATYSLNSLIPAVGQTIFAQIDVYLAEDEGQRVIANNSGPISVWLDGELIVNKKHNIHGIMPSWHLQDNALHGFTRDTFGCADVRLSAGWHSFMLRLDGRRQPQDALFNLIGMRLGPNGEFVPERKAIKPFSLCSTSRWKSDCEDVSELIEAS